MHQVANTPSSIPSAISHKLSGLRISARIWLLVHGLARFFAIIVAVCLVDALIDWAFTMDRAQRLLVGIGVVGALAYYFVKHVISPLMTNISDKVLCQRVEKTNPQLAQRLISAVEFSQMGDLESLGISPAMVDATIDEGTQMAAEINFAGSLRREAMQQNAVMLVLAFAGLIAICVAVVLGAVAANKLSTTNGRDPEAHTPTRMADIWFNRNVLLGDKQWPQKTYLDVIGVDDQGRLVFPRGDDKLLIVRVSEDSQVDPKIVYLDVNAGGSWKQIQMNAESDSGKEFSHLFKNVLKPLQFRVYGGDHESEIYQVVLQPRPEIDSLDLVLKSPEYTGQGAIQLSRDQSPFDVLPGSSLKVSGTASQKIQRAVLLCPRKKTPKESDTAQLTSTEDAMPEIEMTIEPGAIDAGDRVLATIDPQRLHPGEYRIKLVNSDGLESKLYALFHVRNLPDENPSVAARLKGISSLVTNRVVIPIEGKYTDDFAVSAVKLHYQWRANSEDAAEKPGTADPTDIESKLGNQTVEHTFRFDTTDLKLPIAAKLKLELEAKDNDTISGPKSQLSDPFYLTVVTPDELRADMLRREKDYRIEFERMVIEQENLSDMCRTALAQGDGNPLMTDAQRRELEQLSSKAADSLSSTENKRFAELKKLSKASDEIPQILSRALKLQSRMPRRCLAMADRFEAVSLEAENNRLEDKDRHFSEKMRNQIVQPLRQLATEDIGPATKSIESARRDLNKPADRDKHLADAITQHEEIVAKMKQILKHMVKSEGYQDVVNFARKIKIAQEKLTRDSEKERDADLENIFGDEEEEEEKPAKSTPETK